MNAVSAKRPRSAMPSGLPALDDHKNRPLLLTLPLAGKPNDASALRAFGTGGRDGE